MFSATGSPEEVIVYSANGNWEVTLGGRAGSLSVSRSWCRGDVIETLVVSHHPQHAFSRGRE